MYASKVRISQETRARLDNPILTNAKRGLLRRELIREAIRKHGNYKLSRQQLVAAAGFNPDTTTLDYRNGLNLISRMEKSNQIKQIDGSRRGGRWIVIEGRISPSPKQVALKIVDKEQPEPVVELKEFKKLSNLALIDMAKEFAWQNNSDSLREFIRYVSGAIK